MYRFLIEQPIANSDNIVFISSELLCAESGQVWEQLSARLNLKNVGIPALNASIAEAPHPEDALLLKSAMEIYTLLDKRCRGALKL